MKKTVLITGAAKGIGKAIAEEFAKHNYNIIITYLTSEKEAKATELELKNKYNTEVLCLKTDITDEQQVIDLANKSRKKFKNIDLLINNAAYQQDNNYIEKTKYEFLRVLEVNVVGTFLTTKYIAKHMNNGIVLNISSTDAVDTFNELSIDYCASKAGINSLTQTFSIAIPNNKFISVMLPWVNTEVTKEMYPEYLKKELKRTNQKRLLEPFEVAEAIYKITNDNSIQSGSIQKIEVK